jgi:hypothetical protein
MMLSIRGTGFSPKNPLFSASAERLYHRAGKSASGASKKIAEFWALFERGHDGASANALRVFSEKFKPDGALCRVARGLV